MTDLGATGCDLHIPHKEWSGDAREAQNYYEMERWANNFRKHCLPVPIAPTPGGTVIVHRKYFYGSFSVPNNTSFSPNFTTLTLDTSYTMGTAVTPVAGGVKTTKQGFFAWTGGFDFDPYGASGYSRLDWFTNAHNTHGNISFPGPVVEGSTNRIHYTLSGSLHVDANDTLFFAIRQTSGGTLNMNANLTVTVLEFP